MKKFLELIISTVVVFLIVYLSFYFFYFEKKCDKYSWLNHTDPKIALTELGMCKDTLICEINDLEMNILNTPTSWNCVRKKSPILEKSFYQWLLDNFINSITN